MGLKARGTARPSGGRAGCVHSLLVPGIRRKGIAGRGAQKGNRAQLCRPAPRTVFWVCTKGRQATGHDVRASRPESPCQAHANGCPALVVLVAYAAACKPWELSWSEPHRTRCASPKRMLLRAHARMAPSTSLVVRGVLGQQTHCSQATMSDSGTGTASFLSYASTCFV